MPKRELAPEAEALLRSAQLAAGPLELIELIDALSVDERAAVASLYAQWGGEINWRLKTDGLFECAVVLALFLDGDVVDVLVGLDAESLERLLRDERAEARVVEAVTARDRDWAERFVVGILRDPGLADVGGQLALAAMEAHDLPVPEGAHWLGRLGRPAVDTPEAWFEHATTRLAELPSGERAAASAALLQVLTDAKLAWGRARFGGWSAPLVAALGATPRETEAALQLPEPVDAGHVGLTEAQEAALVDVARVRGKRWSAELVREVLRSRRSAASLALIDAILNLYDLPLPWEDSYWKRWLDENPLPAPGSRWQERFLLACEVCALRPKPAGLAEAAARMREVEPTDDPQLLDGLLQVMERSGRPGTQRAAADWIVGLGLEPLIPSERPRVTRLLSTVDAPVAKLLSEALGHHGERVAAPTRALRAGASAPVGRRALRPAARRGLELRDSGGRDR